METQCFASVGSRTHYASADYEVIMAGVEQDIPMCRDDVLALIGTPREESVIIINTLRPATNAYDKEQDTLINQHFTVWS